MVFLTDSFFCRNKSATMSDDEREIENDLDSEVSILFTKFDTNSMSIFFTRMKMI